MKKKPIRGGKNRCPKCASTRVNFDPHIRIKSYGPGLASCVNCGALWEPIDESLIWDDADPACSTKEPCNNCAFRPRSPEQQEPEKWKDLIAQLRKGGSFFCHKGVPIEHDAEHGFAYPTKRALVDGAIKEIPDIKKMRLCRGYLNALGQWWKNDPNFNQPPADTLPKPSKPT